jgi:beta-lactam-binding protein with PASTA domain/predicted Ser/Thr protein kinase
VTDPSGTAEAFADSEATPQTPLFRAEQSLVAVSIPQRLRLSDRYDLAEILGFGGMSEVHLARDVRLHRDVAVKLLRADLARDPDCYLRFRREAQQAAALNHPAIVAVYDTGTAETATGPLPYIVMEYVDGATLRDIVQDEGPLEPRRAIEIIADACQALNFSHRHGTIHRDVKPANIMISTTGAVKVMDFGIARTVTDTGMRLTQTSAVLGTAHYLSPEQARGETVDARSDVYSLGCVLYEMLTGETPFVGDTTVAVAYQHVCADPELPSARHDGISPELDAVVLKTLAKNPDNRYQSAAEMRTDLIRVHSGVSPEAPKVLTDAERTLGTAQSPISLASGRLTLARRWLVTVTVLAALILAVTYALNAVDNGTTRLAVRVPDVGGQTQQDAIASLQDRGFEIRGPMLKPDSTLPAGHVIDTVPGANTVLAGGDAITVNVSSGPEQHEIPDCTTMIVDDCVRVLAEAGFGRVKLAPTASATAPQNKVIATVPAAGRLSVLIDDITIELSSGPEARRVPDVTGQTIDEATMNLKAAGFPLILKGPADSTLPSGRVLSTDPPAGVSLSVQSAVMLKVSRGNQFSMPNLIAMTYLEIVPFLQSLGFVGPLLNAGDVPGPDTDKNRAVEQAPPPGTSIDRAGSITVKYGS